MSRARHCKSGGSVYSGAGSKVIKEAGEKKQGLKHGGPVHMDEAEDKKLIRKEIGMAMGDKAKKRLDKRARGGRIGSDKSPMAPGSATHPFSSAAK
jgi:hypothetical protein